MFLLAAAGFGVASEVQKRGRLAEALYPWIVGGILILLLLTVPQMHFSSFEDAWKTAKSVEIVDNGILFGWNVWRTLENGTPIALLPFLLGHVQKEHRSVILPAALRYYGLIPEEVYTKQSMTLKYAKNFDTPFGRFEYTHISKSAFSVGLTSIKKNDYAFVMATPEKALCDLIANSSKVNLRYLKDAEIYLEEDIRMDREDFMQMDARLFEEYIKVGKKADSIRTLLKLLKK